MKDLPLSPVDKELGLCSRFFGESLDRHSINLFLPDAIIEDCTEDDRRVNAKDPCRHFVPIHEIGSSSIISLLVFESKDILRERLQEREPVDVDNESFERLGTVVLPPDVFTVKSCGQPCQAIACALIDSRNGEIVIIHDGAQEAPLRQIGELAPREYPEYEKLVEKPVNHTTKRHLHSGESHIGNTKTLPDRKRQRLNRAIIRREFRQKM